MIGESVESKIADVVAAHQAADDEFIKAMERHRPQIFRFLLASLRDADLAETLTQDCLLKAFCNWSNFRGEAGVGTWLMRIAINLQKDRWRNRREQFWRQATTNSVDFYAAQQWLPSGQTSPEEQFAATEQVQRVWKLVKALPERQRIVFQMRYLDDLDLREIVQATGLRENTVKTRLSSALRRVRCGLRTSNSAIPASR